MLLRVIRELVGDKERRVAQRHLPEGGQRALLEEVVRGRLRPVSEVYLSLGKPLQELFGGNVDQHDLVGRVENRIRYPLHDRDARDLFHRVGKSFQVLHIDRGEDVDAVHR